MRYWRLLLVSSLLTFSIAGCRRKPARVVLPPQAQPPIISTLPPLPPLALKSVQLQPPKPAPPALPPSATAPPPQKHVKKTRHRRVILNGEPEPATTGPNTGGTTPPPAAALVGKLSAEDSTATPADTTEAKQLIDSTEAQVKKLSEKQKADHKDAVAQVISFLAQARQALSMNDVVGAQTLANKAKILVDELSK